ncbi:LysR family transcriptional regulator [Cohnella terricola]|uniref:LysR family transcriptional regulator n=1 Tax=Cohnella terricola TaxID=1289167 RepID=A0A559J631_9BACL|nr:LysR family transcriptional regulator [Cohnella terricola]TVX95333.1 LysR family transcriptional regulator [Cohnella terricola]
MIVDILKVFVAVVEQRNFSRAGEILNLSQPSVSLHIRNLEFEYGAKLLYRSPKLVKTTAAGDVLYAYAKRILSLHDEAKEQIHLLEDVVAGLLKIGASLTIGEYLLPRFLASFVKQHPQVDVQITIGNTEEIAQGVRHNELDLGLVEGSVALSEFETSPFMKDDLILVAHPDHLLSTQRSVKPDMLQNQTWILRETGSGTRAFNEDFLRNEGLEMNRSYIFNSSQGVKEAVASGLGIAILSNWVVRKELSNGEISKIPLRGKRFTRDFSIIYSKQTSLTMAMKAFMQKLKSDSESTIINPNG